jgi:hypothetical protein
MFTPYHYFKKSQKKLDFNPNNHGRRRKGITLAKVLLVVDSHIKRGKVKFRKVRSKSLDFIIIIIYANIYQYATVGSKFTKFAIAIPSFRLKTVINFITL